MADGPPKLLDCLEDFTRRRENGLDVDPQEYRERLGESWAEFESILRTDALFDEAMDPEWDGDLPRAFGAYMLLRELGRGAVGVVYEAHHPALDRRVALKVLRPGLEINEKTRLRYEREARSCARVRHDHVVEIYEAGEVEGRPYYAMALIEGESLAKRLQGPNRPDPTELCAGLAGIADALQALHDAGVVHRDVKPSNIVVEPSGRYVLADFGLARLIERPDVTETTDTLGTPLYMSPEQIEAPASVGGRTDIYALGVTLFQGLAGKPPFDAESYAALVHQVVRERPRSPREVDPNVPEPAAYIALTCLEKEPDDRYASAHALAEDLRTFAEGRPVSGRPVSRWRRVVRSIARRPAILIAPALAVALLAFVLADRNTPAAGTRLTVRTVPAGAVAVADGGFRPSPVSTGVSPGTQRVRLRPQSDHFGPLEVSVEVPAGTHVERVFVFPAKAPDDHAARAEIVEALLDIQAAQIREVERVRGKPVLDVQLLFPRGKVRAPDAATLRIDVSPSFATRPRSSEIVFRQGERELARLPFQPSSLTTTVTVPERVGQAAREAPITWSVVGEPDAGTFEIIDPQTSERAEQLLAHVETVVPQLLGSSDDEVSAYARALLAAYLRAQVLLHEGFDQAAAMEIGRLLDQPRDTFEADAQDALRARLAGIAALVDPADPSRTLLELRQEALHRMLGASLGRTTLGRKLSRRIAALRRGD